MIIDDRRALGELCQGLVDTVLDSGGTRTEAREAVLRLGALYHEGRQLRLSAIVRVWLDRHLPPDVGRLEQSGRWLAA